MPQPDDYQQFENLLASDGVAASLEFLEQYFRDAADYYSLFEVLKMKCRHAAGLSLTQGTAPDSLSDLKRDELETGLIGACRDIGTLLMRDGRIAEAWLYLQPVGDVAYAESLLRAVEITDENRGAIIDIAFSQMVAPQWGYQLLLEEAGTCDGITAWDVQVQQMPPAVRGALASTLLRHFYGELMATVREHVRSRSEESDLVVDVATGGALLGELLDRHAWLAREGDPHVDTTHLASVVRIARQADGDGDAALAYDLTRYGCRLADEFHYRSDPPFESIYEDHTMYYAALNGMDVDAAVTHFTAKANSLAADSDPAALVAWETLVDLLVRVARRDEAVSIAAEHLVGAGQTAGIVPDPFQVATTPQQFQRLSDAFRAKDDLLGFAMGQAMMPRSS